MLWDLVTIALVILSLVVLVALFPGRKASAARQRKLARPQAPEQKR